MRVASLQILFVVRILCLATVARGQPKSPVKCSKVCGPFTSSRLSEKQIRSYRRTDPQCHREAIIFTTQKLYEICADPQAEWVKKILRKLDQKNSPAASPAPRATTAAAVPAQPGVVHRLTGLQVAAPPHSPAATATALERADIPAARTEATSTPSPAVQDPTLFSTGSSPVTGDIALHAEVSSEANRDSLASPAHSTAQAAGVAPSQPPPRPTALVRGFDSTEEPAGRNVQDTTSSSNSGPTPVSEGSDHPGVSTNESPGSTSARGSTAATASWSFSSALPSTPGSVEISTVPTTPVPPETTSVPALKPTGKGLPVHTNKSLSPSAFGTKTSDCFLPQGKQDLPDRSVLSTQTFPGHSRAQMPTSSPRGLAAPSFLPQSPLHFTIPACLLGGLVACSIAAGWLYRKFRAGAEALPGEMVQGLLYEKKGRQNVFPMEVI